MLYLIFIYKIKIIHSTPDNVNASWLKWHLQTCLWYLTLNHTDIFHCVNFLIYFNFDTCHTGIKWYLSTVPSHVYIVFTDTCSYSYITFSSFLCTKERTLLRVRTEIIRLKFTSQIWLGLRGWHNNGRRDNYNWLHCVLRHTECRREQILTNENARYVY